ncbi:MAG: hypothetical protein VX917_01580 [Chloroflexota bacterium]|jgi:hypothetical protein|nr:hypothetical protein [Chloroflexota bacterium]MQF66424.1 hypothetical protein [SAR202 cluster bacterium AC-647-P02_OGT_505m]|tara:strand:- start:19 stop:279 length:261 start_codon:yes stop_codon:yes gene_type:complete
MGLSSIANVYIIAINPGTTFEELNNMSPGHPDWIYALPTDIETINRIGGLTRSTKILVSPDNEILGRYKMGDWRLSEWIEILRDNI